MQYLDIFDTSKKGITMVIDCLLEHFVLLLGVMLMKETMMTTRAMRFL